MQSARVARRPLVAYAWPLWWQAAFTYRGMKNWTQANRVCEITSNAKIWLMRTGSGKPLNKHKSMPQLWVITSTAHFEKHGADLEMLTTCCLELWPKPAQKAPCVDISSTLRHPGWEENKKTHDAVGRADFVLGWGRLCSTWDQARWSHEAAPTIPACVNLNFSITDGFAHISRVCVFFKPCFFVFAGWFVESRRFFRYFDGSPQFCASFTDSLWFRQFWSSSPISHHFGFLTILTIFDNIDTPDTQDLCFQTCTAKSGAWSPHGALHGYSDIFQNPSPLHENKTIFFGKNPPAF